MQRSLSSHPPDGDPNNPNTHPDSIQMASLRDGTLQSGRSVAHTSERGWPPPPPCVPTLCFVHCTLCAHSLPAQLVLAFLVPLSSFQHPGWILPSFRLFPPLSPTHSTFNTRNRNNNNTSNNTHIGHTQHAGKHELLVEEGIVTVWRACIANACSIPHYHTCSHLCVFPPFLCACVLLLCVCVYSCLPAFLRPPSLTEGA
jgi:hypothetical protein